MPNLKVLKEGREKKFTEAIDLLTLKPLKNVKLSDKLSRLESNSYSEFEKAFLTVLNKQAPLRTNFLRHNNNPFMTKELRKAIMKRSQMKNRYNKNRNYENWYLYKKQSNFCVSLLRKTKRNYFKNVKMQDITDNKKFWETIRPYFSDKGYNQTKITIVEKDFIIADEKKIATLMNNYFINITKKLDLKPSTVSNTSDIDILTKHFDDHISVFKIKEAYSEILREDNFSFKMASMEEVKKVVLKLNSKNSSTYAAIAASILKQTIEVHLKYLTNTINHSLKESIFPDELKQSEVIPIYKKLDPLQKENYRPVSLLPHISKVLRE